MRINNVATIEGNLTSAAVPCTVDPKGAGHLMNILSKMYRDKAGAVVREYAANGRDSHTEAGVSRPIEITLPTYLDPVLTIRDFGVGLSHHEITTVYSCYTMSTKHDRDDQVGGFGIGSKAAYSIGSQFTVTGIKNGERTVVLFALDTRGVPTHQVLACEATTEGNGVTIQVGVTSIEPVVAAAATLFGTWEPGCVLVDGVAPVSAYENTLEIAPGLHASWQPGRHGRDGHLTIVMGGIGYRASAAMLAIAARYQGRHIQEPLALVARGLQMWAEVPIGMVDITPSREDLRDTALTVDTLRAVAQTYAENTSAALAQALDAEPTPLSASVRARELRGMIPGFDRDGIEWRGQRLAVKCDLEMPVLTLTRSRTGVGRVVTECKPSVHLGQPVEHMLVITGADSGVRRLVNRYMSNVEATSMVMLADAADGAFGWFAWGGLSPVKTMTAAEFKAAASEFAPTHARGDGGTVYRVHLAGQQRLMGSAEVTAHAGRVIGVTTDSPGVLIESVLKEDDLVVSVLGSQTLRGLARRLGGDLVDGQTLRVEAAREKIEKASDCDLSLALCDRNYDPALALLAPVAARIADPDLRAAVEADTALRQQSSGLALLRAAVLVAPDNLPARRARITAAPVFKHAKTFPLLRLTERGMRLLLVSEQGTATLVEHLLSYVNALSAMESATPLSPAA